MRWAARIIGLYMTLSLLFSMVLTGFKEGFGELQDYSMAFVIGMTFVIVIALVGCIISWWRQWLAGALLILTWVAIGVVLYVTTGTPILDAFLNESLIFLVAGVLFLLSWWLSRKTPDIIYCRRA